jgi:hypothetical protein
MPTIVNVNELPSRQDRTKGLAEGWRRAAIGLLLAGGLVFLMVGEIYVSSLVDPIQPEDLALLAGP